MREQNEPLCALDDTFRGGIVVTISAAGIEYVDHLGRIIFVEKQEVERVVCVR